MGEHVWAVTGSPGAVWRAECHCGWSAEYSDETSNDPQWAAISDATNHAEERRPRRATYMLMSDFHILEVWGRELRKMFPGNVPYLVGSALRTKDYRDVDVRLILDDNDYSALNAAVDIRRLNLVVSIWGQQVTGLPIDFQVQSMAEANVPEHGSRNPIGLREWSADGS